MSRSSYQNMVRSVVEAWPREPTGYLIGPIKRAKHIVIDVYPVQTADRKPTEVTYGNHRAIKRLRKLEGIWKDKKLHKSYIGGYHGHMKNNLPNENVSRFNELSDGDINFIQQEMEALEREKWIEILMKFENKNYMNEREIEEKITQRHRKVNVAINDEHFHGYKITFSAYLINRNLEVVPLTLKIENEILERKSISSSD